MALKMNINICRVCLKSEKGVNIFEDKGLLEKLEYTLQLELKRNDRTPEILCNKCALRLRIAYDFRKQAIGSDNQMRDFLDKVNNHFNQITKKTESDSVKSKLAENEMRVIIDEIQNNKERPKKFVYTVKTELESGEIVTEEHIGDLSHPSDDNFSDYIQEDVVTEDSFNEEEDVAEEDVPEEEEDEKQFDTIDSSDHTMGAKFSTVSVLVVEKNPEQRVKKTKTGNRTHTCSTCNKNFSTKTNLKRHNLTHLGAKPYKCDTCGKDFTQNSSLKQHMFIHTGDRPHKCETCGRGFIQAKSLIFHLRTHTGEKPFACEKCDLTFRQKDGLKRHTQIKHSAQNQQKKWKCTICNKILQTKYCFQFHMKKHSNVTDPEKTKCDTCGLSFTSKRTLQRHRKQHLAPDVPCKIAKIIVENQ